tara:strand:- start:1426 stop:12609 length:11184 start_codon:yes stop_codon:yes gene_type:complete
MAEFKLGRIRFVWQGDWSTSTTYVADDVISFGGKSYICIKNHTSAAEFNTDFTDAIPKWEIVSDGTSWKADWAPEIEYAPGDVVKYGANVYIAETGHTSATFVSPTFLGLESDLEKWTPFATSFDFKGDWGVTTRYKLNDLVRYGGYVYVCNTAHVSAATATLGLENDQGKWTLFSDGIVYTGEWVTATRYRINDLVKYGGNVWIATASHTSSNFESDETNWAAFVEGFQFEDSWNVGSNYQTGDTITYGGYVYVAKRNNTGAQPTTSADDWDVFTTGFSFQGDWTALDNYKVGDVVRLGGSTYVALGDNDDQEPPNLTHWSLLNSGINWTYSTETFLQVQGVNASGVSGSGLRLDVVKSNTVYTITVSTGFAGTGYNINDVITLSGADIGGTTPANDAIVTVTGVNAGAATTITQTGYSTTWKTGTSYHVGDVVFYGASSFIAVTKHTADSAKRPDNDLTATYWNLLTLGSEVLSLTTEGDLVYYGDQGPTRLPIGVDGQILRATDGAPAWANYGLIDNVVYVGPLGINEPAPASGLTVDKPWSSVRYALEQVRDGYLNPQAKFILKNNKEFLMKEVTNWLSYNYRVNITASTAGTQTFTVTSTANLDPGMPIVFDSTLGGVTAGTIYYVESATSATEFRISTVQNSGIPLVLTTGTGVMQGNLAYNSVKCERDTGYIVDALIYDISRGGTLKTTQAAKSYYTVAGNEYINGTFGSQAAQTVAAYNHLKAIIASVLINEQPLNYQSLNNIKIEDRSPQIIDTTLTAETNGKTKANTLIDIVTTGLAAGSATAIPTVTNPNTTVFIKTGTYNEILPIIVPEFTAINGDELRTSVIQPAPAIALLENDKNKTTSALNRIKAVIPDLMQNIEVAPTTGNAVKQAYINGYGGTTTGTDRLNTGIELISDVLSQGLSIIPALPAVGSTPTSGANNASDAGHANAVAQLEANVDFIVAEQTAWIQAQVDGVIAPFAADFLFNTANCERDTKYIVDALRYDLTYGGNSETTVAARSYFVNGNPVYGTDKKDETLATYAHLKSIIGDVIIETAISPSAGNGVTQDTSGTAGSSAAETFADTRIQEIYDTIDTDGTLASVVAPDITWVPTTLTTVNTDILAAKATIQSGAIDWINENYPDLTFDEAKCTRDLGYIIDALRFDIMFGSDFRSLKSGMSYRRGISSAEVVIESQLAPTIGSIDYVRSQIKLITTGTNKVKESTTLIADILENGSGSVLSGAEFVIPDPTGYDTGFFNARRLIKLNKDFISAEVEAYMTDNYNALWVALDSDDKASCLRDIEYITDALEYDLTYRGNLETSVAARAYYVDGVFQEPSNQKTAALAVQTRIADIIDNIAIGNTAGWTKSSSNAGTQDVTGTAGSAGAAAFAVDRINEIKATIDTGESPALISPTLAWVDDALVDLKTTIDTRKLTIQKSAIAYINFKFPALVYNETKCSRDVGLIIDAIGYDVIFGSNFRSNKAGMSYRRGITSTDYVLNNQLEATLATITFINEELTKLTKGSTSAVGTTIAALTVANKAETIKQILQNGLTAVPALELPVPTGYNTATLVDTAYATTSNATGVTTTYGNASDQLAVNQAFIQLEVRKWLEDSTNTYDTFWATLSSDAQDNCIRDAGYIVDAIRYDMTYGGNTQSLIAGSAYYSNFVLTIGANELPATLAAYARMKVVIAEVIAETTVTKSPGNNLTQDVTGTAGNANSIEFAEDRFDDILDWINNAEANATIEVATGWAGLEVKESYDALVAARSEIIEDTVYWVEKYHQKIKYNQDTCRRDTSLMTDAISRDMLTGSNFASIKSGMAYYRALASTAIVIDTQLEASVGAVNFLKQKAKHVAAVTAAAHSELIIEDITKFIDGGKKPTLKIKATTVVDENDAAAATAIWGNKNFIQQDVIAYLKVEFPSISYSEAKCKRDVGMMIDALRYDLVYGGTHAIKEAALSYYVGAQLQIDDADKNATIGAYQWVKFLASEIAENSLGSPFAAQTDVVPVFRDADVQVIGNADSALRVVTLLDYAITLIDQGDSSIESITITGIASNVITSENAHNFTIGSELIVNSGFNNFTSDNTYFITSIPTSTTFTVSTSFNGATLVLTDDSNTESFIIKSRNPDISGVTAVIKQQNLNLAGSKSLIQTRITTYLADNYPTLVYNEAKCSRDVGLIVDAIGYDMMTDSNYRTLVAANAYYRGAQADLVLGAQKTATVQSYRELKNAIASYIGASKITVARANNLMDIIIGILDKGANETPETVGTVAYYNNVEVAKGVEILKSNKDFLSNEATAWVTKSFGGTVTQVSNGDNTIATSAAHYFIIGDPVIFGADIDELTPAITYYVKTVPSATTFTVAATSGGAEIVITTGGSTASTVTYSFDPVACRRDMTRYIDAIVYDLQYPGNHHAIRSSILYLNAIEGSERSDMFYVRNSTGVRNMTISGLRGNLTEENEFGTRRPTAGAYVSLDPGFGPWDRQAWITNKSPYIQNVTTFGVGCVGNKIDGALHAGGNRSTVSNDFTQVLSDGIGVWCTGNNSLTELVSVFAYYNYSGYLADLGGRIRATNGNSSYGTFGTIAEGTDTGEIPLFSNVDNLSQEAFISEVITDGDQEVLRFEFDNAGRDYTNAQYAISGSGFNAATVFDETRDGAIFETRLIDLDNGNGTGGADYVTAKNVAQGGTVIQATIAATDTALLGAYNGMRIQITAGSGVGQYANILSYNNGLKVAKVYKDSFENLTVTGTTITSNVLTVANTASLYVNMPIYLSTAISNLAANTVYYVLAIPNTTTFTVSATEGGSVIGLTTTTAQTVTLYAAGWDHVVPGTVIAAGLDLTSGYTIEPRIKFTAPGFATTATTTSGTEAIKAAAYADDLFIALQYGGTATYASSTGKTWAASGALSASANWNDVAFGGGSGAKASVVIGGSGGSGATFTAELGELNSIGLPGPTQVKSITVVDGGKGYSSPPTITITATNGGSGATAVATVLNGSIQKVIMTSTGAGFGGVPTVAAETDKVTEINVSAFGNGYRTAPTVTISGGGASTAATAIAVMDNQGVASITIDTAGDGYTSVPTIEIVDGASKFVAIANGTTNNASLSIADAKADNTWTAGTALPNSNFTSITYGNGVYVAVGGSGGSGSAATSTDGNSWVSRTNITLSAGSLSSVAYGAATYVAINTGGNKAATSTNGIVWTEGGTLPSSNAWASVAYGNGRFVAVATGSKEVAVSYDKGATWVESPAGLPTADNWSSVKYGQGLFMAVAEGTAVCATSADGITWNQQALSASDDWFGLVFGNPNNNPIWAAFTDTANNVVNYVETGAKALGRLSEADGAIISTRMAEPGSGYPNGTVTSVTAANTITLNSTSRLVLNQPITFTNITAAGLINEEQYFINTIPNSTTITVSLIAGSGSPIAVETVATENIGVSNWRAGPIATITDPNSTIDAPVFARQGNKSLANPTFTNRGSGYQTATVEAAGDGYSDLFQAATFIAVRGLFDLPQPGSNVEFASKTGTWYKLVAVSGILGSQGNYDATFQISPALTILDAPLDGTLITTTNKYSQVRLTGHDFLYIGTGNQAKTNYPFVDITTAYIEAQQLGSGGGRVFYTSTDQDGNFNVGGLFGVQQSTGTATLDADAFNLAGLQSLQLNGIGLGIGSAVITQFSTDPFFTANSDNIVPTQRAIKSYITAQIGGGQSSLNVNTLTSGVVFIANDEITTTNGGQLNITAKMNFTGGIDGAPVALGFFLSR